MIVIADDPAPGDRAVEPGGLERLLIVDVARADVRARTGRDPSDVKRVDAPARLDASGSLLASLSVTPESKASLSCRPSTVWIAASRTCALASVTGESIEVSSSGEVDGLARAGAEGDGAFGFGRGGLQRPLIGDPRRRVVPAAPWRFAAAAPR